MNGYLLRSEIKGKNVQSRLFQYHTGGNSNRQEIRQKKKKKKEGRKNKRMDIQIKKKKIKLSY